MTNQTPNTDELKKIRSKFEKKMGDAWEKYDSSEFEGDLEEYGEDYEKAYDYLFDAIKDLLREAEVKGQLKGLNDISELVWLVHQEDDEAVDNEQVQMLIERHKATLHPTREAGE